MKFHHLLAGAAAVLLAASQVQAAAASTEFQTYVERAEAKADAMLRAAGVDIETQSVTVRVTVNPDGRLTGAQVVRSSGSPATDHAVETVLRKIVATNAPLGLVDGAVTLNLGRTPLLQARAP
jgi:TonB family protein